MAVSEVVDLINCIFDGTIYKNSNSSLLGNYKNILLYFSQREHCCLSNVFLVANLTLTKLQCFLVHLFFSIHLQSSLLYENGRPPYFQYGKWSVSGREPWRNWWGIYCKQLKPKYLLIIWWPKIAYRELIVVVQNQKSQNLLMT